MNKVRKLIYIILMSFTLNTFATGGSGGGGVLEINPRKVTVSLIGGNSGGGGARPFSIEISGGNSGSGGAKPISKVDGGHEL